jgi:hypothetical protein
MFFVYMKTIVNFVWYDSYSEWSQIRKCLIVIDLNFALEYAIRELHEIEEVQKLNRTNIFLDYTDNANLLDENINTIKNTEPLLEGNRRKWISGKKLSRNWSLVTRMQDKTVTK